MRFIRELFSFFQQRRYFVFSPVPAKALALRFPRRRLFPKRSFPFSQLWGCFGFYVNHSFHTSTGTVFFQFYFLKRNNTFPSRLLLPDKQSKHGRACSMHFVLEQILQCNIYMLYELFFKSKSKMLVNKSDKNLFVY